MRMLDSLSASVRDMTERTAMKHDLLKLRLQDKSYIVASSDLTIMRLLQYYEKTGSIAEKQEVYYYAGSVTRHASGHYLFFEIFGTCGGK